MNINFNNLSDNFLLSLLSSDEQATISSAVKLVPVNIGDIICESEAKLEYVYFPISGMFLLLYILENGGSAEISDIGKEGFVGVPILLGGETMPHQVIIQGSGEAFRMPVYHLTKLFTQSISFRNILLHYMQALMTQISQTAVCNSHQKLIKDFADGFSFH
ncbi:MULTISPECIES: Crp/Fnr family transcriptional regulator [Nitrosomonas]|uniref:Cyclic nucleotide-binding domain-containing protein n=1 Tax=Nitrosomonas communis TaxID=44574 RepID=A0A5D3Y6U5_9PROT|nr:MULTISPECIES: Crp/Fnr family transcriptional regulator [Nitrosomonas]TYP71046.1 Cyclic nucleotide-binding domain-containing protein [Nitrosomonas communis]UVS60065.1 Crp/Fnr family transcriptional regulator [Nitrosomonas sp. PLL12]